MMLSVLLTSYLSTVWLVSSDGLLSMSFPALEDEQPTIISSIRDAVIIFFIIDVTPVYRKSQSFLIPSVF